MNWITINILDFIRQYLGRIWKDEVDWQSALLDPLRSLFTSYDTWRRDQFFDINVTGQVIALEGVLNSVFDPIANSIEIIDGQFSQSIKAPYNDTHGAGVEIPLNDSEGSGVSCSLDHTERVGIYDFEVNAPAALSIHEDRMRAYIDARKLAGKKYIINYI